MSMITGEPSEDSEPASHRVIIVGVDDSAEAEAAAQWAVREAELRKYDVLLVHAYEVQILPPRGRAAAIARGRQERQGLLDKVAGTLTVPPTMHLDQLIEIDSPGFLLPRLSERRNSRCSVKIIRPSPGRCHSGTSPTRWLACRDIP
jgi:hypothetical protein